jgi:tRNA pseudouridine55 synthase
LEPFSHNIEDYPEGIVLPVDKPYRWTSADVIRKLKFAAIRHFSKKKLKVGHAGTLDPLATGILLVCIGPATKRAEELQRSPKQYLAGVTFGATTPSYDLEKEIDRFCPLDGVSEESVRAVLPSFIGEQEQVAPLFSAKSVDGVRAYETARRLLKEARRNGTPFDPGDILQSSLINIYDLRLESFAFPGPNAAGQVAANGPETASAPGDCATPGTIRGRGPLAGGVGSPIGASDVPGDRCRDGQKTATGRDSRINVADISSYDLPTAMIRVDCSKGTYIRSLARDLGEALGSGAFLSSLRRTANGGFTIEDSVTLDQALDLLK